jgi:hypothetical protein
MRTINPRRLSNPSAGTYFFRADARALLLRRAHFQARFPKISTSSASMSLPSKAKRLSKLQKRSLGGVRNAKGGNQVDGR